MLIFNEEDDGTNALWATFVNELMADGVTRAHGCNLQHDPRVSNERAKYFWEELEKISAAQPGERLSIFVENQIRSTNTPDFSKNHNDENHVPDPPKELVTLLNINGLDRLFSWARDNSKEGFKLFESSKERRRLTIDKRMQQRERESFLPRVFELHAEYSQSTPYHPVWLTCPDDLDECQLVPEINRGSRLCERVGISTETKGGEWIVVLKFTETNLKKVYRPTCIDGVTEYHFPSPEGDEVRNGGIGIDLNKQDAACLRVREYIAEFPAMNGASYELKTQCFKLEDKAAPPAVEARREHVRRLRKIFAGHTKAILWCDRVQQSIY